MSVHPTPFFHVSAPWLPQSFVVCYLKHIYFSKMWHDDTTEGLGDSFAGVRNIDAILIFFTFWISILILAILFPAWQSCALCTAQERG